MSRFADKYKVNSSRLVGWSYSSPGIYFITICTYLHNNFFGKIKNEKMEYKPAGKICVNELLKTFDIRENLKLNAWVVMPNHVHILFSVRDLNVETHCNASLSGDFKPTEVISSYRNHPGFFNKINIKSNKIVPRTIKLFKGAVFRECQKQNLFFGWQSRYFDEIIEAKDRLFQIKNYIKNNVNNWQKDKLFVLEN